MKDKIVDPFGYRVPMYGDEEEEDMEEDIADDDEEDIKELMNAEAHEGEYGIAHVVDYASEQDKKMFDELDKRETFNSKEITKQTSPYIEGILPDKNLEWMYDSFDMNPREEILHVSSMNGTGIVCDCCGKTITRGKFKCIRCGNNMRSKIVRKR